MIEKRFRHMRNRLGMQFIGYDEKYVLLGTFADAEGVKYIVDLLNQLNNKNEQLKKRNNNQYNQLNELWQIIEEENWEKLIAMKKQLKEDEERLQQEWKCYE